LPLRNNFYWFTEQRGATTVEAIFLIAFFGLLFFGGAEIGRAIMIKHSLDIGVYEAARYLSLNPHDTATAEQMIRDEVDGNLLGGGYGSAVQIQIDMPSATFGTVFRVQANLVYQPVVPLLPLSSKTLHVEHTQVVESFP